MLCCKVECYKKNDRVSQVWSSQPIATLVMRKGAEVFLVFLVLLLLASTTLASKYKPSCRYSKQYYELADKIADMLVEFEETACVAECVKEVQTMCASNLCSTTGLRSEATKAYVRHCVNLCGTS